MQQLSDFTKLSAAVSFSFFGLAFLCGALADSGAAGGSDSAVFILLITVMMLAASVASICAAVSLISLFEDVG